MKKSFFIKLLFSLFLVVSTTGCEKLFDEPEPEEDNDPQEKINQYYTQEQQDIANTAKDVLFLTEEEKKVIYFCNLARLNGSAFSDALLNIRESDDNYEKTLVEALDTTKDLPMLIPNEQLCKASAAHAEDIGPKGLIQHPSSDGTKTFDRVKQYYHGHAMAENISAGYDKAFYIVRQLLIDRNTPSLGHRKTILSPNYDRIGVAIRPHTTYNYCCVQDFSDDAGDNLQ